MLALGLGGDRTRVSIFISEKTNDVGADVHSNLVDQIEFYHKGNFDHVISESKLGKLTIKTFVGSNG